MYVFDVLLYVVTESQLWNILINVQNIHWYVAVIYIDQSVVKLKIRNDIEMRNILAEEKLVNIGEKYR